MIAFYSAFGVVEPAGATPPLIGVLISQEIKPFVDMVEGLEENLNLPTCRIFLDSNNTPYSQDPRFKRMEPENYPLLVAVGPRALSYLTSRNWTAPVVYCMVLNPERFVENRESYCGVSLNFDLGSQIDIIKQTFPEVKRLGILFDPANNQKWFASASPLFIQDGITPVPLMVSERTEIRNAVRDSKSSVDAIFFIPDKTVISRTIIQYVIKEAILLGIPTIGYNRFFFESGSAMSFIIDYREMGKQAADLVKTLSERNSCSSYDPRYHVLLNRNVVRTLGVKLGTQLPVGILEGN